jgi:hypothetical protein
MVAVRRWDVSMRAAALPGSKVRAVVFERRDPTRHMPTGIRRDVLALLGLSAVTIAVLALAWSDPMALCALPALVLPALFALRRYPGERILAVLSEVRRQRRQRPASSARLAAARAEVGLPRGGLLLARSLAVRPPPSARLAAS